MSYLAGGNHDALAVIFYRYQRLVIRVAMTDSNPSLVLLKITVREDRF